MTKANYAHHNQDMILFPFFKDGWLATAADFIKNQIRMMSNSALIHMLIEIKNLHVIQQRIFLKLINCDSHTKRVTEKNRHLQWKRTIAA